MNGNTRQRLTYTADDIEALLAALHRLPERTYAMKLGQSDLTNMISVLITVEELDLCNMRELAHSLRSDMQNNSDNSGNEWRVDRQSMVNLIGLLYIVAWSGHKLGFKEYQCDWSRDFYSAILETLDIELV